MIEVNVKTVKTYSFELSEADAKTLLHVLGNQPMGTLESLYTGLRKELAEYPDVPF